MKQLKQQKYLVFAIVFISLMVASANAWYKSKALSGMEVTDGLVAFFPMDNYSITDEVTGKRAYPINLSRYYNRHGHWGYSQYFDGYYDYVELPHWDFYHLDQQNLSVSAWVKYNYYKNMVILDNKAKISGDEQGWHFGSNQDGYLFWMSSDETNEYCKDYDWFEEWFLGRDDKHYCYRISYRTRLTSGWNHVAVTKSGTRITFYLNGVKTDTQWINRSYIKYDYEASRRYIGTSYDSEFWDSIFRVGDRQFSQGWMDDIRVYNRPISSYEVSRIYNFQPDTRTCLQYFSESKNCISCRYDRVLTNDNKCVCPAGKFDNPSTSFCYSCEVPCGTCSGTATNCLTCVASSPPRVLGAGCTCPEGYYDDGFSWDCKECPEGCKTCSGPNKCDSCHDEQSYPRMGDLCTCPKGSFHINDTCMSCDPQCETCDDAADNCTKCKSTEGNNRYLQEPTCPCYYGYFQQGEKEEFCTACNENCKKCSNPFTCDECWKETDKLPYCTPPATGFW